MPPAGTAAPASPAALFRAFTCLALQGFGGVLPVAQREIVDRQRWLDKGQFLEMLSIAQVLPGPNIINLSLMIGDRFFGWRGALAAMSGMLLAPLAVVLLLAALVSQSRGQPLVAGALRGMGVVAAGLVVSTAWRLGAGLNRQALGGWASIAVAAATLVAVGHLRLPLAAVVLILGGASVLLAWWRAGR